MNLLPNPDKDVNLTSRILFHSGSVSQNGYAVRVEKVCHVSLGRFVALKIALDAR